MMSARALQTFYCAGFMTACREVAGFISTLTGVNASVSNWS